MSGASTRRIGRDAADMTARVLGFPAQLRGAWQLAREGPDLLGAARPRRVWVVGMGGSAIGGDFVRAFAEERSAIGVEVVRGYALPGDAGPEGFAFFVSYSGNTEETLASWDEAARRGLPRAAVTSGGALLARAQEAGAPVLRIPGGSPPRAALGWTSVPVLHALARAELFPEIGLEEAARACEEILAAYGPSGVHERALADWGARAARGLPIVYAADRPHRATATRWIGQINENGKTLAHAALFPEQNHNEIVPWERVDGALGLAEVVVLDDPYVHPRVRKRLELVARRVQEAGREVTRFAPCGEGLLARLFSLSLLGDLASLHVAAAKDVDPTPVAGIDWLKKELG